VKYYGSCHKLHPAAAVVAAADVYTLLESRCREAERGQVVADILYLEVARQLQAAGMQLLNNLALLSPNISQPPPDFMSAEGLQQLLQQHSSHPSSSSSSSLVSPAVADAVVSYLASTFEGGDARMMDAAAPPVTPLSVDRLQVGGSSSSSSNHCFI
jgi:hypothetical protein